MSIKKLIVKIVRDKKLSFNEPETRDLVIKAIAQYNMWAVKNGNEDLIKSSDLVTALNADFSENQEVKDVS